MNYIHYAPEDEMLLKNLHWEVWNKLPSSLYKFEEATSRGGHRALRAEGRKFYIWITPKATEQYKIDNGKPFLAFGRRSSGIHFVVSASDHNLIATAKKLNKIIAANK